MVHTTGSDFHDALLVNPFGILGNPLYFITSTLQYYDEEGCFEIQDGEKFDSSEVGQKAQPVVAQSYKKKMYKKSQEDRNGKENQENWFYFSESTLQSRTGPVQGQNRVFPVQ